jgi:hypothetical protein
MIPASNDYAIVADKVVIFTGNKKRALSRLKTEKSEKPGRAYSLYFSPGSKLGDIVNN